MRDLQPQSASVFGVISQFGDLPQGLAQLFEDSAVFVNSDIHQGNPSSSAQFIGEAPGYRPNPGHSLGNFFEWVISNYESLPERVAFVKSNIVPRHVVDFDALKRLLANPAGIVMLWSDPTFVSSNFQDSKLFQNFYLERNNSWFLTTQTDRRFSDFDAFMDFVFTDWPRPKWIPFSPGACYLISREHLESVPKELFRFLLEASTYKYFPAESYAVERAMWLIFNQSGTFQDRFLSSTWRSEMPNEQGFSQQRKPLLMRAAEALEHFGCSLQQKYQSSLKHSS